LEYPNLKYLRIFEISKNIIKFLYRATGNSRSGILRSQYMEMVSEEEMRLMRDGSSGKDNTEDILEM